MATFAVWEVHVDVLKLKCYAALDLVHIYSTRVRAAVQTYILHPILSDLSFLIIKPKYGKQNLYV
jgi:hypothetical protein